jgi:ribose transport system substrate-binding protein
MMTRKTVTQQCAMWLSTAVLFAALVLVCGCKDDTTKTENKGTVPAIKKQVFTAPAGATLKLAFVTNNASDFWKIAAAGVKKYESEAGIKVDVRMPPTGTVAEQNGILEDLTTQGYNGLSISVIAPEDQIQEINRAAAKMNVITHDSDAPKSNRLVYIGTNNYEAGRTLGKEIVKLLPSGGKIAVFVGTFAANNASERLRGIEEEIKGKNINIVAKKEDNKDPAKAQDNPNDVIVAYPDINMLVGLWSYNGPAIASAIDASSKKGKKILAAVFDEEDGTLDGIEKGTIQVTVVQKPFQFGYLASKLLHDLATKGEKALPKNELMDTGVEVINSANVKQFRENLKAMKK